MIFSLGLRWCVSRLVCVCGAEPNIHRGFRSRTPQAISPLANHGSTGPAYSGVKMNFTTPKAWPVVA